MATFTAERASELGTSLAYLSHRPVVIDGGRAAAGGGRHNVFGEYRFSHADIAHLPRIVGRDFAVRAELLPVIERLSRHPAGSFRNVSELYASLRARGPRRRATSVLQRFFLDGVDRRLQDLYRRYLAAHPLPPQARHDQKIAALEAVHVDAQAIVNSYDWQWLADWLQLDRFGENAAPCVARLSNLAFVVTRVNFRFTYHCNIECRHCYNSSGPHLKAQRIALDPMLAIIAQMPRAGIGHLNLTGGEPFLYPDHLVALIAAGRAADLRGISIYTNGYWATTDERATRTLERLAAAGFMQGNDDYLKVSTGIYHQEFIAFDRVLALARAYHAMFGRRLRVDCELAPGESETKRKIQNQISEAGLSEQIELSFRTLASLGRAKEIQGIVTQPIDGACNIIDQIVFDPDGSARPCCGLNNENQGVIVGSLQTHTLKDLVKRMQNDPILQFLATNPMNAIFDYLDRPESQHGYSGKCHLCQDALGSLSDKEPLQARLFDRQKFYPFWFKLAGQTEMVPLAADAPPADGFD